MFFSEKFITELGNVIQKIYPGFDQAEFNGLIYTEDWEKKELKEKMHHTTRCLGATLPKDFAEALGILTEVAPNFKGFDVMVFPDYVEHYGLDDWDLSLPALAFFTTLCSSEFAIRPFLDKDPERTMPYLYKWALDEDMHLRRLASEGCRPRLPWAMALPKFKKDPTPILQILETLKDDPDEYVRRSVANNLNDISKDNPDVVLDLCERWFGENANRDWVVKRACRTLLKAGNTRALMLFGFGDPRHIEISDLAFAPQTLVIGDELHFSFKLKKKDETSSQIRLEYAVDYVKARNKVSRKIFQIKEAEYNAGNYQITRKHSFKQLSTRKHYPGPHQFTIIVNGVEKASGMVDLA